MAKKIVTPYEGKLISSISDVSHELRRWDSMLTESEGEITSEMEDEFAGYIQNKERMNEIILELRELYHFKMNQAERQDEMIAALERKKDQFTKSAEYYKSIIKSLVKVHGNQETTDKGKTAYYIETNVFKVRVSPSQAVEILDADAIESKYKKYSLSVKDLTKDKADILQKAIISRPDVFGDAKIESAPVKTLIKEDLEKGIEIAGAELKTNESVRL